MKTKLSLALAALALTLSGSAFAGTNSTPFTVQADVVKECAVDGGNLVFPNTSLLLANVDATANIQIECTGAVPYSLAISAGNYTSGAPVGSPSGKAYQMTAGSAKFIGYVLYSDASHTTEFNPLAPIAGTSTGGVQQIPVYGRIYVQASKIAGTYTGSEVLTLTY